MPYEHHYMLTAIINSSLNSLSWLTGYHVLFEDPIIYYFSYGGLRAQPHCAS
jgi:hypothetical protein